MQTRTTAKKFAVPLKQSSRVADTVFARHQEEERPCLSLAKGVGMQVVSSIGTGHLATGLSPVVIAARGRQGGEQQLEGVRFNPPKIALPELAPQAVPQEMTSPQAVDFANLAANLFHTNLSFDYDERINQVVVKVMDDKTGQVIRQIPPEHMVQLVAGFKNDLRGLILNHQG
jgi:hypothetical protein